MRFEEWASKNLKDRYLSVIERLKEQVDPAKCTIPFVPYCGSRYGVDKPKILIVGKATYGWGKGDEGQGRGTLKDVLGKDYHILLDHLSKLSEEFIEDEIIPFYGGEKGHYHSNFWNRIYRLTGHVLSNAGTSRPSGTAISIQAGRDVREEVDSLKPHIGIALCRTYAPYVPAHRTISHLRKECRHPPLENLCISSS